MTPTTKKWISMPLLALSLTLMGAIVGYAVSHENRHTITETTVGYQEQRLLKLEDNQQALMQMVEKCNVIIEILTKEEME